MRIQIICEFHKVAIKKVSLLAAMATNQNKKFGKIHTVGKGLIPSAFL